MSKKESMLFELMETCNFRDVFEHCSEAQDSLQSRIGPAVQSDSIHITATDGSLPM